MQCWRRLGRYYNIVHDSRFDIRYMSWASLKPHETSATTDASHFYRFTRYGPNLLTSNTGVGRHWRRDCGSFFHITIHILVAVFWHFDSVWARKTEKQMPARQMHSTPSAPKCRVKTRQISWRRLILPEINPYYSSAARKFPRYLWTRTSNRPYLLIDNEFGKNKCIGTGPLYMLSV